MSEELEFRPRFGVLRRHDGTMRTVVFYPHETLPNTFVCHYADNEQVAVVDAKAGDRIQVDNLAPGQAIFIEYPNQPGPVRGRLKSDKDKDDMAENENTEDKVKDPNAVWKGLVGLAGFVLIVVLGIKGVVWALG